MAITDNDLRPRFDNIRHPFRYLTDTNGDIVFIDFNMEHDIEYFINIQKTVFANTITYIHTHTSFYYSVFGGLLVEKPMYSSLYTIPTIKKI